MRTLLPTNFVTHYGLTAPTISFVDYTTGTYFEIEDTASKDFVIHTTGTGCGMAKFSNANSETVTIANYDKFIGALSHKFQQGKKRCDFLLTSNSWFVLGELKDRNQTDDVRVKARNQLISTLETIREVPEILTHINTKTTKRCIYFNKQAALPSSTIITATIAFSRLSSLSDEGFKMSNPTIENLGFEFWEYSGNQTVKL